MLQQQKYGNEFTVGHNYDSLDRETSRVYNNGNSDVAKYYWTYNADGNLARYSENGNRVLTYLYDDIGRLLQVSGNDGSYVKTSYDKLDKSTDLHYKFNGQRRDVYFNYYNMDNLPLNVKFGTDSKYIIENNYDELTRLKFKTYTIPSTGSKINTSYSYVDWSGNNSDRTTGTVRGIDYTYVAEGLTTHDRWYTYDNVGNILTEKVWTSDDTKPLREKYTYDAKNQLVRHDSATLKATYTYAYDAGGNITTKKIYAYTTDSLDGKTPTETINYTYGNSAWGDELTSYGNESIEYDKIGNPTLYRGWGMTWQGRQLTKAVKDKTVTFTYDSEGIRTSKSDGTNTTKYLLNGTQILAQKTGSTTLSFFYDQQGNRVGMADGKNNFYYYIYNVQGDVIALADASTGKLVVTYTYDVWGKLVKLEDTTANSVGTQNPFRYKGYYYDTETKLYYLQSRYYDPEVGRFINADAFTSTDISGALSANMFAYCENNPVMRDDPTGEVWTVAVKMLVGAAVSMASYALDQSMAGEKIDIKELAMSAAEGAITAVVPTKYATAINAVTTLFKSARAGNDLKTTAMDVAASVGSSLIGSGSSYLGGKVKLAQFKNKSTKGGLKALGRTFKKSKRNGNEFKQLSNWDKNMNRLGAWHFANSAYGQFCGYLGSGGFSLTYGLIKYGR